MSNRFSSIFFCLLLSLFFVQSVTAQSSGAEKQKILTVVQTLFDAMAKADSAKAAELFLKNGHTYRVEREEERTVKIRESAHSSFISRIGSWEPGSVVERMWDSQVLAEDGIAMVWAPYDLHVDGEFSHCGVDLFSLIKTEAGWKIADITYSVKQDSCKKKSSEQN